MNSRWISTLLLSLAAVLLIMPPTEAADDGKKIDEDLINARAMEFVAAGNDHDLNAIAMLWAEDGDFISPFNQVAQGREEIEKLFAADHGRIRGCPHTVRQVAIVPTLILP